MKSQGGPDANVSNGLRPQNAIGAPDANTRSRGLADNAGSPSPCPDPAGVNSGGRPWYTPTLLAEIRNRQRRVAADMGLAFWDWEQAMGGRCSAHRWRNQVSKLIFINNRHLCINSQYDSLQIYTWIHDSTLS